MDHDCPQVQAFKVMRRITSDIELDDLGVVFGEFGCPGVNYQAFEVTTEEDLNELQTRLRAAGHDVVFQDAAY